MESYKEEHIVNWQDIDGARNLRHFTFMNMASEIANAHCDRLGFGYDELIRHDQVWVLSRAHIRYFKSPQWKERVAMETWHKGKQGVFWIRDFVLHGADGSLAAAATTSWVIINVHTRRIERRTVFDGLPQVVASKSGRHAIEEPCGRIAAPEGPLAGFGRHRVKYSDIDFNLHANNAKYVEWIMDCIPLETLKACRVEDLRINYIAEAHFGDDILIQGRETSGGTRKSIYLEGRCGEKLVFQSALELEKRK